MNSEKQIRELNHQLQVMQTKLQLSEEEIRELNYQLKTMKLELELSKNEIIAMESSKIWQLQKIKFKIKGKIKQALINISPELENYITKKIKHLLIIIQTVRKKIIERKKRLGYLITWQEIPFLIRKSINQFNIDPDFKLPEKLEPYTAWLKVNQWNERSQEYLQNRLQKCTNTLPKISVVMPVLSSEIKFLELAIMSVVNQIYDKWELCIIDDHSTNPEIKLILDKWAEKDQRINVMFLSKNGNISAAINGEFILFLDQDDELTINALAEVGLYLAENPTTDYLYSDNDKIDDQGHRYDPQFKPDWHSELLLSYMYLSHLCVVRRTIFEQLEGLKIGFEWLKDDDFILRLTEISHQIAHLPLILYHCRATQPANFLAAKKALRGETFRGDADKIAPDYNPNLSLNNEQFDIEAKRLVMGKLRPIKTMMFTNGLHWEGAPNSQFELTVKLKEMGIIDPVVFSPQLGLLKTAYEFHGIPVYVRENPLKNIYHIADYHRAISQLAQFIKDEKIELVYGNTLQTFYAIAAAEKINLPSIWNMRESSPWHNYFDNFGKAIAKEALQCFQYPYSIIFVSNCSKEIYLDLNTNRNFTVIHNGLNLEILAKQKAKWTKETARKELNINPGEIVLLMVGRICEQKGQSDLLKAVAKLPLEYYDKIKLFIVGDRPNLYSDELKSMIKKFPQKLQKSINIIPNTPDTGLYYQGADIFVFTSRLESFPRVILEAMAYNLPIITSPVFGIREQVQEGINALFYEPGDIQSLMSNILRLIQDEKLRLKFASNSDYVLNCLNSFTDMSKSYSEIFQAAYFMK